MQVQPCSGDIMDIALTKMNSRGQVVIPSEMRKDIMEDEKLVLIKNNHQLILKKASAVGKNLVDDLIFAKRTEDALKKYERGEFIEMDFDDFFIGFE